MSRSYILFVAGSGELTQQLAFKIHLATASALLKKPSKQQGRTRTVQQPPTLEITQSTSFRAQLKSMGDQIAITETRTAVLATENAELDAMAQAECKPTTPLEEATISSTPTGMSLRDQIALIVEETKILDSQGEEQKKGFLKGVTLRQQIKLLDEQSSVLKRRVEDQGRDVVRMGIHAVKERRTEEFVQEVHGGKGKKNLKSVYWEEGAMVQDGEKVAVDHDEGGSKVMNRGNFDLQRQQGLVDGFVAGLGFAAVAIAVALTWKFVLVR